MNRDFAVSTSRSFHPGLIKYHTISYNTFVMTPSENENQHCHRSFGAVILWVVISLNVCAAVSKAQAGQSEFTIIVLPDTQYYSCECEGGQAATFLAMTQWIVDNTSAMNIVYVDHMGDLVQSGDTKFIPWQNADAAMSLLEDPLTTLLPEGIPFGLAVGNHDQTPPRDPDGTTTYYNQFFGESRFTGRSYYGGHYGDNNDNHYDLFSAAGLDFIVIFFEYDANPGPDILTWADNLLTTYSDRRGIVVIHNLLDTDANFSSQGQATYDALKHNENFFLMLGGHRTLEIQRTDVYNGKTVHSFITDYQMRDNGGDGWLRILEFSPVDGEIHVKTYSPTLDLFETDADSDFILNYDMGIYYEGVWVDLGTADDEHGLNRPSSDPADGTNQPYNIGGKNCRKNVDPNSDYYMYFQIDDSYALEGNRPEVYVTCQYYDQGPGTIQLQYDGTGSAYTHAASVTLGGTNTWQSYTWHVTDGYFGGRQNSSSDLRIYRSVGQTMYLNKVEVANYPPGIIAPIAVIDANPARGLMPLEVHFDGSNSYDSNGTIVSYEWDLDNDGTIDATGVTADYTYEPLGTYTCKLIVTDDDALTNSITVEINVVTAVADFDGDQDVDQEDFGHMQICMTGTGKPQNDPACQDTRLDEDDDVDLNDFSLFQGCMSGANVPQTRPECLPD